MIEKNILKILFYSLFVLFINSCDFLDNSNAIKENTEHFINSLIQENYDECLELFAIEHELGQNINLDTIKKSLPGFRDLIISNFGESLDFSLMSAEKTIVNSEGLGTPPNTIQLFVQIENSNEFGVIKILGDEKSNKLININLQNVKEPIPNLTSYWLFACLAISILAFNLYVIRLILKSNKKRKWLKVLAVLFFNVPAITYSAVNGFSISVSFQILLGISFGYMGYLNSFWTFGIPLGGIYWLWRLKRKQKSKPDEIIGSEPNNNDLDILDTTIK